MDKVHFIALPSTESCLVAEQRVPGVPLALPARLLLALLGRLDVGSDGAVPIGT